MYFDMHSDIWNHVTVRRLKGEKNIFGNYHKKMLQEGNVEGAIFVIWVDPPFDDDYAKRTAQIFECAKQEISETQDFRIVKNVSDIQKAKEDGIFYVMIGVEGMAYIGDDIGKIDEYYEFGARHASLTWNEANKLGAGALSGVDTGLTAAGKAAVKRLQELGMIVDISHLNDAGVFDIAKVSTRPFIASHSNARALCNHPRNLSDDILKLIKEFNGAVGLNAFPLFINEDTEKQNVHNLALHADYIISKIGIDHVMCGFDFCDFLEDPETMASMTSGSVSTTGFEDHSKVNALFECFDELGLSKEEKEKIGYKNAMRILKETVG